MTNYVVAITTAPQKDAENIAKALVESKVCACVNVISNVVSIYHWKGQIETEKESILLIKTMAGREGVIWDKIKENHPYDLPELIVLPVQWGKKEYLEWISEWVSATTDSTMRTQRV